MKLFIALLVSSLMAVLSDKIGYTLLCKDMWNLNKYSNLVIRKQKEENTFDSDLSIGFHFNPGLCQEFGAPNIPSDYSISAYHSDDNHYIYLYITGFVKDMHKDLTTKTFIFSSENHLNGRTFLLVIWLKELQTSLTFSHSYRIDYNSGHKTRQTPDLTKFLKYSTELLIKDFDKNSQTISTTLNSTGSVDLKSFSNAYTIRDSYVIFCGQHKQNSFITSGCEPIEDRERIHCRCKADNANKVIIFIILIFWCSAIILSTKPILDMILGESPKRSRIVFGQAINCNDRNCKFKHIIGLRLATNMNFDLTDVTVDVEFFTSNNESIAPALRFKADIFMNRPVVDIKIHQIRLTKLPVLKMIECNHSGNADIKIVLFGVYTQCVFGDNNDDIKWFKINKTIVRNKRQFNLKETNADEDVTDEEIKALLRYPGISLSYLEMVWISFVDITLIATIVAFVSLNGFADKLFFRMLCLVLLSTIPALIFHILFTTSYKCLLLLQLREESKINSQKERLYFLVIKCYYFVSLIIAMALGLLICIQKHDIKDIQTYQWLCVTFCSFAIMVQFLVIYSVCDFFCISRPKTETEFADNSLSIKSSFSDSSLNSMSTQSSPIEV